MHRPLQDIPKFIRYFYKTRRGRLEQINQHFAHSDLKELNKLLSGLPEMIGMKFRLESVFNSIHEKLNAGVDSGEILNSIFDSLGNIIPFDRIGIALIENNGEDIRLKWVKSRFSNINLDQQYVASLKDSSLKEIISSTQPRIINDLEKYLSEHPESISTKLILKDGILSNLTCPLFVNAKPAGVIFFSSGQKNTYAKDHVEIYCEISQGLSLIIAQSLIKDKITKTEEKEKMFRDTLHDLNNPLWAIQGALEIINKKAWFNDLGKDSKKMFSLLRRNCDAMIRLVREIVYTVKDEKTDRPDYTEDVPMETFLREIQEDAAVMARAKHIYVFLMVQEQLPAIMKFNPLKVKQALGNYIANAIKYSNKESSITIKVKYEKEIQRLNFIVKDEGPGINEDVLPKLFQERVTASTLTSPDELSSGRGLLNVKHIINSLGGEVSVQSRAGEGSSFAFWIPVKYQKANWH